MSADLPGTCNIYAKREDLNSGLAYGGNKVRKLEYLLSDALAQGCDTLISVGGVQSNHTRQVTAVAKSRGMKALPVQNLWVEWDCEGYEKVGNIQLTRLMGGEAVMAPDGFSVTESTENNPLVKKTLDHVRAQRGKPYWIPAGASDHPLGGLGFARWALEVAEREKQMGVFFDTIIVCAVTGSTFGGMIAGFKLLMKHGHRYGYRPRKIIGIGASAKPEETRRQVLKIAKDTAAQIGLSEDNIQPSDVHLEVDYAGPAYGIPDDDTVAAIKYGASMDAFITDPVYEGKTLCGLLDLCRSTTIDGNILFAQLGGQVALNAYTNMEEKAW